MYVTLRIAVGAAGAPLSTPPPTIRQLKRGSMASEVLTTLLSLAGVGVGSAASFAAQYLTSRETKAQAAATAAAALRAERKQALHDFLESCQRVERAAEHRFQNDNRFVEGSPTLTHDMWFRLKCLDLVSSRRLNDAAYQFADRLMKATYGGPPNGKDVWEFINEKRGPFMEAAKVELDIPI
ncbi:hypothetical protein ABZ468_51745 [Streptomyces sp. NPDC005708]|uniref:hypothetical protein n=1 Tax=unclassified Streptomyces TaxID=2593676 RepID=UPI0033E6A9CF